MEVQRRPLQSKASFGGVIFKVKSRPASTNSSVVAAQTIRRLDRHAAPSLFYSTSAKGVTTSLSFGRNFSSTNQNNFIPAVVYVNADIQKLQIIQEKRFYFISAKGKAGIYRFTNLKKWKKLYW